MQRFQAPERGGGGRYDNQPKDLRTATRAPLLLGPELLIRLSASISPHRNFEGFLLSEH